MAPHKVNEALLDQKLADLEQARTWSPRVVSRLETLIRTGEDFDLFRVNPIRYARERGMAETESIDLFLHAVHSGLFEMDWNLVCPLCGHIVDSMHGMKNLHGKYVCNTCILETEASLDDWIFVSFTISPLIRDIAYHHPDALSAEDYVFHYQLAAGGSVPVNRQPFEEVMSAMTRVLAYLEPGEKMSVELEIGPGLIHCSDFLNKAHLGLMIGDETAAQTQQVPLAMTSEGFSSSGFPLSQQEIEYNPGALMRASAGQLRAGRVVIDVHNRLDRRSLIWFFYIPAEMLSTEPLLFEPHLTGKRLLTTQTFRDLFRAEVVKTQEGIGVRDITVMFTDLKDSTQMYDQIGDPKAYYLVSQHFEALGKVVSQYEGATIKTIGDAVMATFMTPLDGISAALGMLAAIDEFNKSISQKLSLKIGLHRGQSILVTLNDRLDYFGQTVNVASRVQGLAGPGEIYVTQAVYDYPGVRKVLEERTSVEAQQAALKGISEQMQVYKLMLQA